MKFEDSVKLAFVKMAYEVIKADGKIHPAEIEALNTLKEEIGIDDSLMEKAKNLTYDDAIGTLYNMPYEQKKALSAVLDEIAHADGTLHKQEINLIVDTFINLGMGEESD